MRKDLTDITLVVDRSGSMESCRSDAEGGINAFIREQRDAPGDATFSLVQFDTEYEFVHKGVPIADVGEYAMHPRAQTALLDTVGRAINEAGERLEKTPEEDRPGCVVFVIVTDGHENASREFTLDKVRELITRQREEYNWQFTFIGADAAAFDAGHAMGVAKGAIARSDSVKTSYSTASKSLLRARGAVASGQSASLHYTDEERASMSEKGEVS